MFPTRTTLIATLFAISAGMAQAATFTFTSPVDGAQAVPGTTPPSSATGVGTLTLDDVAETLQFSLDVTGINVADLFDIGSAGPVHIHLGTRGDTGPVVVPFTRSGAGGNSDYTDTASGFLLTSSLIDFDDLASEFDQFLTTTRQAGYYINVHTNAVNSGEIRGQLAASPVPVPASGLLLIGALGGLIGSRKLRKKA